MSACHPVAPIISRQNCRSRAKIVARFLPWLPVLPELCCTELKVKLSCSRKIASMKVFFSFCLAGAEYFCLQVWTIQTKNHRLKPFDRNSPPPKKVKLDEAFYFSAWKRGRTRSHTKGVDTPGPHLPPNLWAQLSAWSCGIYVGYKGKTLSETLMFFLKCWLHQKGRKCWTVPTPWAIKHLQSGINPNHKRSCNMPSGQTDQSTLSLEHIAGLAWKEQKTVKWLQRNEIKMFSIFVEFLEHSMAAPTESLKLRSGRPFFSVHQGFLRKNSVASEGCLTHDIRHNARTWTLNGWILCWPN